MSSRKHEEQAEKFVAVIERLASKPDNLNNLQSYLSFHFEYWLEKYANTPERIVSELEYFAEMEF